MREWEEEKQIGFAVESTLGGYKGMRDFSIKIKFIENMPTWVTI